MPIPKSAESRLHTMGLLSQPPQHALATLLLDAPYLSDGRAKIELETIHYKNPGQYASHDNLTRFIVDGKIERDYSIINRPAPASWDTEKGRELRLFLHRVYDRLHDLAREAEARDEETQNELLLEGRRNAARLIEQASKVW